MADAIGAGLGTAFDVSVVPVSQTGPDVLAGADLAVVGGPTHAHGITRAATRKAAVEAASKPVSGLKIEPTAIGPGCASGSARSTGTRSRRRRSTPGCAGRPR